jgi:hypothetical protein
MVTSAAKHAKKQSTQGHTPLDMKEPRKISAAGCTLQVLAWLPAIHLRELTMQAPNRSAALTQRWDSVCIASGSDARGLVDARGLISHAVLIAETCKITECPTASEGSVTKIKRAESWE